MNDEIKSKFGSGYKEKIKNVENLIKVSSDFEQNNFESSLDSFIIYLRDVAKSDYDDPDTTELSGENSVKIMSIHAAKGLEFEVVFLPMLWKNDYIGRKSSRGKFEIPSCLRKDGKIWKEKKDYTSRKKFEDALKGIRTEEERRIFYVACSRARKVLALSYCEFDSEEDANKKENKGKEIVPFFAAAIKGNSEMSVINLKGAEYIRNKVNKNFNKNIESYSDAIDFIGLEGRHSGGAASAGKAGNVIASRLFTECDQEEAEKSLSALINKLNAVPGRDKEICKIFKDLNTDLELNCNLINSGKLEQWRNRIKFTGHDSRNLAVLEEAGRKRNVTEKNFSLTSILDYIKCPVLYKWKYIYKIPEPETERLRLGERVHKYIEYITMVKHGDLTGKQFLGKNIDEDEILGKIKDGELKKYIEVFLNSNLLKFDDIEFLLLEQLFYWKLSGYFITGKIDRMDMRKDGKMRIIDYKVSNYSAKRKNVQHENQLKSYISSACEIYEKSTSDVCGCLLYLGNSKEIELSFKARQIKEFETLVLDIIKKINKNIFDADIASSCKKDCSYYDLCAYIN
jgi:DNA helicase-2/ATP-dependent DNA helicase PcrA